MSLTGAGPVAAQLRIVNYNVAQLDGVQTALRDVFAALNADDKPGFAAAPHLYVFQEVQSSDVAQILSRLNAVAPPGVTYAQGLYTNSGEDGTAGAQAMFYRSDTLIEDPTGHADIFTGGGRNADRWKLRLVGYDSPAATFFIYSAHLKAGTNQSDEQTRASGANAIRNNADALPAGTLVIYAGDFNVYSNNEPAYQRFIAPGTAQAFDPLGSGSWGGSGNAIKHTQSPQLNGPLVGGGMDDRFDMQLSTAGWHDGEGLALIPTTYRSLGNDGQHYNLAINDGDNFYYPGDLPRSNALADDLYDASDHVPVVADYQLPAAMTATLPADFGRVIQGASVRLDLQVFNSATVVAASGAGADELDFTALASGALSGGGSGSVLATIPPSPATIALTVDTATVGDVSGTVQITSISEAVQNASITLPTSGTVLRPSNASFSADSDQDDASLYFIFQVDTGLQPLEVALHNFGYAADQALLDVDSIDGIAPPFSVTGPLPTGIAGGPGVLPLALDTGGLPPGAQVADATIQSSDEDLPGEQTRTLSLALEVEVRTLLADVDGDCVVDLEDLTAVLAVYGRCDGEGGFDRRADFDNDRCIALEDLATLLTQYGATCP